MRGGLLPALILDGLCLHVLSSFQRTGFDRCRPAHLRLFRRVANLSNLRQPACGVNKFVRPTLSFLKHRVVSAFGTTSDDGNPEALTSVPDDFPIDWLFGAVERGPRRNVQSLTERRAHPGLLV